MAYQPQRDPTNVLGRRFGAFIIDYVLGNAIAIAFLAATKSASYTGAPDHACSRLRDARGFSGTCVQLGSRVYTWDSGRYGLGILLGIGVVFLNAVILQGITGASVGKMITGIRVVNEQGNVAGIGRAFLRWVFLLVDLGCFIIGLVSVSVTHPHRRVGDMVAGTYVIGTADVGQPVVAPSAPSYAYAAAPPPGGWAPPQPSQSGWGTPPQAQPAQWGAPPAQPAPQPQPPAWGAPPAPAPQPSVWPPPPAPQQEQPAWGAPPPSAPQQQPAQPAQPPPAEGQPGWAAPQYPQQRQPYVPPPPPAQPQPQAPQQPYVPPPPADAPPAQSAPPSWGAPPTYPPPPTYPAPPSWGAPPEPAPEPPAATPPAQNGGESWWDKGVQGEDGEDETEG